MQADIVVSIAICTYNRAGTILRTLSSLNYLRCKFAFEVIVVNGPSTDRTAELLSSIENIRVLETPHVNLSISRNTALAAAVGKYIAYIDDDAVPEPDWLQLIVDRFESDENISAVGGFIRDTDGIHFQAKYVFCDCFGESFPCDNLDYYSLVSRDRKLYPSLTGTNTVFKTADIREIGGFDEVFAYYLDETDVNKRMYDRGMISSVIPCAEIHHKYAASHLRTKKRIPLNMYPIARSIAYFAIKHGLPEKGMLKTVEYLQEFYKREYNWKTENFVLGDIDSASFEKLIAQIQAGIIDGIDRYYKPLQPATDAEKTAGSVSTAPPSTAFNRQGDLEPLRILMLNRDHNHLRLGGIGVWSRLVAKGLAERGNEVTVISELDRSVPGTIENVNFNEFNYWSHDIDIRHVPPIEDRFKTGLPDSLEGISARKYAEAARVMPRRQFQIASTPIWDVEGGAIIARRFLPTVLSLHTCAGIMLNHKPEWRENENYYKNHVLKVMAAERRVLLDSTFLLANSKAVMSDIGEIYGIDLFKRPHAIIPHGVEDIQEPLKVANRISTLYDSRASRQRVLFLGRLEARKGITHALKVIRKVLENERIPNVDFDIVGESTSPEYTKMVKDLINLFPDRVVWHGFLENDKLDSVLRTANVLLAPSTYESFGLIYIECMRYSIPSVAFSVGGVTEVIDHGHDGMLAELSNDEQLYRHLSQLISNRQLLIEMARNARRSFEDKFGCKLMVRRIEDMYREIIRRAGSVA